jgi:23S rRNA pseudouridine1911/1915/1917 synthase
VYGGRLAIPAGAGAELKEVLRSFRRQALHASQLQFTHPASGESLAFEATVPADLETLVQALGRDAAA